MTFVATRCVFWALSASNNIHCIPNSAGELQHSSKAPSWWGGWWGVLSPYSLGRSCLKYSQDKFLPMPVGSVSNRNYCKRFCFEEKFEKHWFNVCIGRDLIKVVQIESLFICPSPSQAGPMRTKEAVLFIGAYPEVLHDFCVNITIQ